MAWSSTSELGGEGIYRDPCRAGTWHSASERATSERHASERHASVTVGEAGRCGYAHPIGRQIEHEIAVDLSLFSPRSEYLLRVQIQAMIDAEILDGDLIGAHPTADPEHDQIVVARLGNEGIIVKRCHLRTASRCSWICEAATSIDHGKNFRRQRKPRFREPLSGRRPPLNF